MTSQRDESSITGTVLMSGSDAMRFRKRVIAATEIEHRLVHVHVDDLGARVDLLPRHLDGLVVAILEDELGEAA